MMHMGKTIAQDQAEAKSEKKKRTVLSPAERIAKMKAEVEAAEAKLREKAQAKLAAAEAKVSDLTAKRDKLNDQIQSAKDEVASLRHQAGVETNEQA